MTHLERKIDQAKSNEHAYRVASDIALMNYSKGDKSARNRSINFDRKANYYAKLTKKLQLNEAREKNKRLNA